MYHGKKFKEATGYDDHLNGEKDIKRYISYWSFILIKTLFKWFK